MTIRRLALALAAAITLGSALIQGQVPSRNVNMVSGRTLPDGDPYLQRQNEPSIAASARNPLHLLAGANDYRTVDLPGLPADNETGDAWMGVFKSYDGGNTWRSTLIPGYPQDKSDAGKASPLWRNPAVSGSGYTAAADPVVRAGTNGLFYYMGIVFDRGTPAKSALFVTRFIDNNNQEAGDPIVLPENHTKLITTNPGTAFIDKPWFAVDIPRSNAQTCTTTTKQKSPTADDPTRVITTTQSFPGGAAYAAFSLITEDTSGTKSQVYLTRSTDCGLTWSAPLQISSLADPINQGATLAIDPRSGSVYIAWRRFSADGTDDTIMVTRSQDQGRKWDPPGRARRFPRGKKIGLGQEMHGKKFKRPVELADLSSLDQPTQANTFRTNAYPTMTIDGQGRVYVAWSERGFATLRPDPEEGDARIMVATSTNVSTWSAPTPVDNGMTAGHQVMPSLSFAGGKLMVAYYDFREDVSEVFQKFVDETAAVTIGQKRHTVDVRAAQGTPGEIPTFGPSVQVSEYLMGSRGLGLKPIVQLQYNPPNLKLFKQGTVPFFGDYIDLAPSPAFVPAPGGGWAFNTAPASSPLFHVTWTDNRDVVPPPPGGSWADYTPPTQTQIPPFVPSIASCVPGFDGMRNQNIYTARITGGLVAGSPGNTKTLSPLLPRAFVVFAQNATDQIRTFRFTIENQPIGGRASFLQQPLPPYGLGSPAPLTTLQVIVPPRSTVARNVFATSTDPHAQLNVTVKEIVALDGAVVTGGMQSTVVLNPDISNPDISNPDISNPDISNPDISNPDISNSEVSNPDISNPDISNPDISNKNISNPDISNPDISNPDISNPDISNPDFINPDISNPDISNPDISNPDISNPDISNQSLTDTTWTITNQGNTTAAYSVKLILNGAKPTPAQIALQLILRKVYATPVSVKCLLSLRASNVLLANIIRPDFTTLDQIGTPDISNATLWLAPGETAKITLRVMDKNLGDGVTFNAAEQVTPVVLSQALNVSLVNGVLVVADEVATAFPPTLNVQFPNPPPTGVAGTPLGIVSVRVTDPSGAVLPGVIVTLSVRTVATDAQVGDTLTATTNVDGTATFDIGALPAGAYRLRAQVAYNGVPSATVWSAQILIASGIVEWSLSAEGNGHFYEYVLAGGLSWDAANAAAQARSYAGLSGHLVSIASPAENNFVLSLKGNGDLRAWIGLHDPDGSGAGPFAWVTGETFNVDSYRNWAIGEPDNLGSEFWVEMFADGTWNNNLENDPTLGYIVEYETPWTVGQQLTDPAGDATTAFGAPVSPDLISASTLRTGNALVFQVRFAPGTFDAANTLVDLLLDTDRNPATGHQGTDSLCVNDNGIIGAEYLVTAQNNSGSVLQYAGVCNSFSSAGSASVVAVSGGYDITVPLAAIGGGDGILNYKVVVSYQISPGSYTGALDYMSDVGLPAGTTGGG